MGSAISYGQYQIKYTIIGLENVKVYLLSIHGSVYTPFDSGFSDKGLIQFIIPSEVPVGVYRIKFGKNLFSDVILNHENVVMQNNMENLLDNLIVTESEENKIYYDYWRTSLYINDSIDLIAKLGQKIYEANKKVITSDLDSMAKKAYQLDIYLEHYIQMLINKSQGMYVQKLLNAYQEPNWDNYRQQPEVRKYGSRKEFMQDHFFDHLDFSDSTLLNSEVFYVLCTDYLNKYVDPESDSNYQKATEFILQKTVPDSPVYKYILNLLVNTFSESEWEGTFVHLVEDYLTRNTCDQNESDKSLTERAATIKKLRLGNPAPDFALIDERGKPTVLYSIQAKVILLFFWSSSCPHCEKVIPQIVDIYKKYHPLGLEIVAVSVDTDKKQWTEAIAMNKMIWINLTDLKGMESPAIESYNAFSTPDFFLLDSGKTIIAHPYSPREMQENLEKLFP